MKHILAISAVHYFQTRPLKLQHVELVEVLNFSYCETIVSDEPAVCNKLRTIHISYLLTISTTL